MEKQAGDKSSVSVRFIRLICAAKWPPASITPREGVRTNNDTRETRVPFYVNSTPPRSFGSRIISGSLWASKLERALAVEKVSREIFTKIAAIALVDCMFR